MKFKLCPKVFPILGSLLILLFILVIGCNSCNGRPPANANSSIGVPMENNPIETTIPIRNLSVYLENSGSMHGYVKGNTGFEQFLFYYLTQIQNHELADSICLNYVNSQVISLGNDVERFIHRIEPVDFANKGGNTGTSDIAVILDMILSRHHEEDISMFISDCIISPGRQATDIENYLIEQRTKIENSFVRCLKKTNSDLVVTICQLTSSFDGKFYNKRDDRILYKGNRPFYIWLIGNNQHIKQLLSTIPLKEIKDYGAAVENISVLLSTQRKIDYGILLMPRRGYYKPDNVNPKTTICNIKTESKGANEGDFMFSFGANLGDLPLDDEYLLDVSNYEVSNKGYQMSIKKVKNGKYSHIISLSSLSPIPQRGDIRITLKNQFPQWAIERTDTIGENLVNDQAEGKTYGFRYLVEGCYNAFKSQSTNYAEFKVTIK